MFIFMRLVFILTAVFFLVAVYALHSISSRDPTSLFFNPRTGYTPLYSTIRRQQAASFLAHHENNTEYHHTFKASNGSEPKMCVGLPSIARKGARYLKDAVGSLLEGLSPEERSGIHLMAFFPHSDPFIHPDYAENWLGNVADEVLTYELPEDEMNHVRKMEKEGGLFREKGLFDYSYILRKCVEKGTPYVVILEDDTLAMDGWYHRTLQAISDAENDSAINHGSLDFLYLRLFYTEEFQGWNSEYWAVYLSCSLLFFASAGTVLFCLRSASAMAKRVLTARTLLGLSAVTVTCILLFFALGRVTVNPRAPGVALMSKYGCCSQGFVFPRRKAAILADYYLERKIGFVDVLTEEYADNRGELRYAITPSVIQHVGRRSSKVDDYGPSSKYGLSVAEKIWSFAFERYDSDRLRKEHDFMIELGSLLRLFIPNVL
ncbi:integral membrane protein-like protein [Corynespora cassiicola Philippines]|uniref:Integral membrane protein-like protein n=1 Tax=Corynespora cassiicola Philippines TaxID=1448308 RepID=A0A2T2P3T8_CORCC|nr:integral membrane protein-like protein [Corynespora cassiicola Philippines]